MGNFFVRIGERIGAKRVYFWLLVLLTLGSIVLAVFSAVQFSSGVIAVDLSNIVVIRFLKNEIGIMAAIFLIIIGLLIFYILICVCHAKPYLIPIGVVLYLYLVYSQVVVLVSVIMTYGFLNCILVATMLILYLIFVVFVFLVSILDFACVERVGYFKNCFNYKECMALGMMLFVVLFVSLYVLTLAIMKSFMILLVY